MRKNAALLVNDGWDELRLFQLRFASMNSGEQSPPNPIGAGYGDRELATRLFEPVHDFQTLEVGDVIAP